jgi:hypothetical protein
MLIRRWICYRFHRKAGPWQDSSGQYERCLDCGRRIPWIDTMPLRDPTKACRESQ